MLVRLMSRDSKMEVVFLNSWLAESKNQEVLKYDFRVVKVINSFGKCEWSLKKKVHNINYRLGNCFDIFMLVFEKID